jgi:transcriptional regulator
MPRKDHGRKKLTDSQIEAVRVAIGLQVDIAIRFGITQQQVSNIKRKKRRNNERKKEQLQPAL